jgi:hypothetical protein
MKLTFFLSPFDQLDVDTKVIKTQSSSVVLDKDLGMSATIEIERSEQPQSLPVHSMIADGGKEIAITANNSVVLPARFVLRLKSEMPIETRKYHQIVALTGIGFVKNLKQNASPLFQLISKGGSSAQSDSINHRGAFVVSISCLLCSITVLHFCTQLYNIFTLFSDIT